MRRCGSVVTLIRNGKSLYAWVRRFVNFGELHVAHVQWLPTPDYPLGTPLVTRLSFGGVVPDEPVIVSLNDIDPSQVSVLHINGNMHVMRMSGINTM